MPLLPSTAEIVHDRAPRALTLTIEPARGPSTRHPLPRRGSLLLGGDWAERLAGEDERRVTISDPAVSARHARIELVDGRARIVDLGSRNGTWLGGARIEAAELHVGACAIVGRSALGLEDSAPAMESIVASPDAFEGSLPGAIGRAPVMRALASTVRSYASFAAPVLIRGESGSGKEVVARALHQLSARRAGPFHAVNLGALPRELAEGELFGHERGAFTGAIGARPGLFELAHGGTLLLDELGELPLEMQAKLLRVLETGEVRRLGARAMRAVDVRIVAATWAPLEARIADGTFREDLYHRIAVLVIDVPPLRDRRSDVPAIAQSILDALRHDLGEKVLSPAATSRLVAETWSGNVRELRNVVYRAATQARGRTVIEAADVARALTPVRPSSRPPPPRASFDASRALEMVGAHGGNITAAAKACGVKRETFRDWVRAARGPAAVRPTDGAHGARLEHPRTILPPAPADADAIDDESVTVSG